MKHRRRTLVVSKPALVNAAFVSHSTQDRIGIVAQLCAPMIRRSADVETFPSATVPPAPRPYAKRESATVSVVQFQKIPAFIVPP